MNVSNYYQSPRRVICINGAPHVIEMTYGRNRLGTYQGLIVAHQQLGDICSAKNQAIWVLKKEGKCRESNNRANEQTDHQIRLPLEF